MYWYNERFCLCILALKLNTFACYSILVNKIAIYYYIKVYNNQDLEKSYSNNVDKLNPSPWKKFDRFLSTKN